MNHEGATPLKVTCVRGLSEELTDLALPLCMSTIPNFDADILTSRLPLLHGIRLWLAWQGSKAVGFKLGYDREAGIFYSWLGGVELRHRRRGVASVLMNMQHSELRKEGYRFVETRARAANTAMIIANLKHGFEITGCEHDTLGRFIVWQRKALKEDG